MNFDIFIPMSIGVIIGCIVTNIYIWITCKTVGTLKIDTSDEDKDKYTFEVAIPFEELNKQNSIRLKIRHIASETSPNMK